MLYLYDYTSQYVYPLCDTYTALPSYPLLRVLLELNILPIPTLPYATRFASPPGATIPPRPHSSSSDP